MILVSQANVPGNHSIRLHFPVVVEETKIFMCCFSVYIQRVRFLAGSLGRLLLLDIGNGDVAADYRPDAPTHEEPPFLFFPCFLYRVSFHQLHKFAAV